MNLLARRRPSRPANMPPWETARASFARMDKLKHVPRGVCFSLPRRATDRLSLHQPVKIYSAIVIRHIDLTSVNYRRIELIEHKRDGKLLGVPKDFERSIGSQMHGVID